jgi:hypothetical protein
MIATRILLLSLIGYIIEYNGMWADEIVDSNFQELPIRIVEQPQSQTAISQQRVVFKCDYEASAMSGAGGVEQVTQLSEFIKVRWLFNSKLIRATASNSNADSGLSEDESAAFAGNTVSNAQYMLDKNRLIISKYEPSLHTGQYRCFINNTLFSPPFVMLSEPANLSLASKSALNCYLIVVMFKFNIK